MPANKLSISIDTSKTCAYIWDCSCWPPALVIMLSTIIAIIVIVVAVSRLVGAGRVWRVVSQLIDDLQ